jgi:polyisoprenoid-binding protein YceI
MSTPARPRTTWTLDPLDTTVAFTVRHFMVTNVGGVFQTLRGTARYDASNPESAELDVEIPAASLTTRDPARDGHLRSSHFFDVDRYPTITFHSTRVRSISPNALELVGDLTLRGTTREVVLAVSDLTGEQKDHNGTPRIGARATATIRRSDFGMTYNILLDGGGVALGDEVKLTLDVSLLKDAKKR